ncbi:hypothetical protein ACFL1L_02460 [Thermoplasmatota archaeon]
MMKKVKFFICLISLSMIFLSFNPLISSENNKYESYGKDTFGEIILYKFEDDGSIIKQVKKVPIKDALVFIEEIKNDDDISFDKKFNDINFVTNEVKINNNKFKLDEKQNYKNIFNKLNNADIGLVNFVCDINFNLILDIGFVFGTHAIPIPSFKTPGIDVIGFFIGLGSVHTSNGVFGDQQLTDVGLRIGGVIGFVGTLGMVIIPFMPILYTQANGFAVAAFWI